MLSDAACMPPCAISAASSTRRTVTATDASRSAFFLKTGPSSLMLHRLPAPEAGDCFAAGAGGGFSSLRGCHDATRYSVPLIAIRRAASCRRSVDLARCLTVCCRFGRFRATRTLPGHRRRDRSVGLDLVSSRSSCRDVFSGSSFLDEAAAITSDLVTATSSRQLYTEISGPS